MASPSPAAAPAAGSPISKSLQQLRTQCGSAFDDSAPSNSGDAKKKKADHHQHHERSRQQRFAAEQMDALYKQHFASSARLPVTASDVEQLVRLLPSLAVLSAAATSQPSVVRVVHRLLHPQRNDAAVPHLDDAVLQSVLTSLATAAHRPEAWAGEDAAAATAIRATAAGLLAQLLRHFVAAAPDAAVEAQWRQWQALAKDGLLEQTRSWVDDVAGQRTPAAPSAGAPSRRSSAKLSPAAAECALAQLLDLVDAIVGHPCARAVPPGAWPPLLASVVRLAGAPQEAPRHLALTYAVLAIVTHVRETGVVGPGVWRQLTLELVRHSIPHGAADGPVPTPVSPFSSAAVTYATVFLKYVHVTKALLFLSVEESATGDSTTARDDAAELHAVVAGLVELSPAVLVERPPAADAATVSPAGHVSLLAAVVKDLLSVRAESRSAPRQYARYVQGMLAGPTPLLPAMVSALAVECQQQTPRLAEAGTAVVLAANAEVLQGALLWSIHAVLDEGLLDATRRADVVAALPWALYDGMEGRIAQLSERLACVLLADASLTATRGLPVLAVRVIACEGLRLLLSFLLLVVAVGGVADDASWSARFRDRLYAAETRVLRLVGAFDCGVPSVLRAVMDELDRVSATLGPTTAKVSALLPTSTRPALASAGCHGALEKLLETIPIF